jgi:hypothetical protein
MATEDQNQDQAPDFLSMSDDELANFDPTSMASEADKETTTELSDKEAEEYGGEPQNVTDVQDDDAGNGKGAGDADEDQDDTQDDVDGGTADAADKADKDADGKDGKTTDPKANDGKDKAVKDGEAKSGTEGAKDESAAVDYKSAYEKLMAPFKANGREIQAKSVEDAISLMQMGANYNKKMAGLKPSMKFLKMLESNDLLDESKLGFLIDLSKRDPAAINKLVLDSKLDPLDLSAEKAGEYKPGNHSVDDREVELDEVINELRSSEHFTRTLQVVGKDWDVKSRGVVASTPDLMRVINGHMESGIYDRIVAEMESERTFGRLKGLSDLEAYRQVGDAIEARGGFNDLFKGSSQEQAKSAPATKQIVEPKPKQAEDDKLKDKRRAASGTRAAPAAKGVPADFNPLNMSDDDFAKFQPT